MIETAPTELIAFFANIGNRDIALDGATVAPPREEGERLLKAYETEKHRLSLPMLDPALSYLKRSGQTIKRIVLFATDQSPTVEARHRHTDTIHFAQIARKLIEA